MIDGRSTDMQSGGPLFEVYTSDYQTLSLDIAQSLILAMDLSSSQNLVEFLSSNLTPMPISGTS